MNEIERVVDQLRRSWDGDAWHGPALAEVLADVTAEEARARPVPSAHTILELVLHLATWQTVVRRRLTGERVGKVPDETDWPETGELGATAWRPARAALTEAHRRLVETAAAFPRDRLDEPAPDGGGDSFYVLLHGVLQHDLYHAGQIALLKKELRRLG